MNQIMSIILSLCRSEYELNYVHCFMFSGVRVWIKINDIGVCLFFQRTEGGPTGLTGRNANRWAATRWWTNVCADRDHVTVPNQPMGGGLAWAL